MEDSENFFEMTLIYILRRQPVEKQEEIKSGLEEPTNEITQ